MSLLILSAADVDKVIATLSPDELVNLMASVFAALSDGSRITSPHRTSIQMKNHKALFMPSRIEGTGTAIKLVSVPTSAAAPDGLPASTMVIDEETGGVKALVNARSLTALRNAAGSLLATRIFATDRPQNLVSFGAGKQIEAHVNLFLREYPSIQRCTVVNRTENARLTDLLTTLRPQNPTVEFVGLSSESRDLLHKHLIEADIVCTATSSTSALFESSSIRKGTHLNLIGSYTPDMREIDTTLIMRAGKVIVDSRAACCVEAGELIQAKILEKDMVELGELIGIVNDREFKALTSKCADVKMAGDITIFKSVGVGLQDVAIANLVVNRAGDMGFGTRIDSYDSP